MTNEDRGDAGARPARLPESGLDELPVATAITGADLEDARRALADAEKRARRHLLWAAVGLSPAALIPFLGLLFEGSFGLVAILLVLVFLVEGWRFSRANSEAQRLRVVVERLVAGHADEP